MSILYMNQGVKGGWGAIKYSNYDIICLAESANPIRNFDMPWASEDSLPIMSIHVKSGLRLRISEPRDLDPAVRTVRPVVIFGIKNSPIKIVFLHLKAASQKKATDALAIVADQAIPHLKSENHPVLWIGDFNRALSIPLANTFSQFEVLIESGGQALWYLDRAYKTGGWGDLRPNAKAVAVSAHDHGHAAIEVAF